MDSSRAIAKAIANAAANNEASSKNVKKNDHSLADEAESKNRSPNEEEGKSMPEEVLEKTDESLVDPIGSGPPKANQDDSSDSDDELPLVILEPLDESSNINNNEPNDREAVEEEYECKYCNRKFTNKQSLGGHQNAHKLERALEKDVVTPREVHETKFGGYTGGGTSSYPRMNSPSLYSISGPLKRSHEVMSISRGVYTQQLVHQPGLNPGGSYMHPVSPLSMTNEHQQPYTPRPFKGYFRPNPNWTIPAPRVTPYVDRPSFMQNLHPNLQFSTLFTGSSISGSVSQGLSGFTDPRIAPGGNIGRPNNNQQGNAAAGGKDNDEDDSGLDLTLRL